MPTNKLNVRFYGIRLPYGSPERSDQVVAVEKTSYFTGILEVFELHQEAHGALQTIPTAMGYRFGGTSTSPQALVKLEVLNPNASGATFSLALLTTPIGSPDAGNAFLAWNTSIAGKGIFTWTGFVPLIDRYVYAQASIEGLLLYRDLLFITPQ